MAAFISLLQANRVTHVEGDILLHSKLVCCTVNILLRHAQCVPAMPFSSKSYS